jgi:hypothetical protein
MQCSKLRQLFGSCSAIASPRQAHREHRAFTRLAGHRYIAAHQARELAGYRQSQACAAILLGRRCLGLGEFLE